MEYIKKDQINNETFTFYTPEGVEAFGFSMEDLLEVDQESGKSLVSAAEDEIIVHSGGEVKDGKFVVTYKAVKKPDPSV